MGDSINTAGRNNSVGTEDLQKSGRAVCALGHQVLYTINTFIQGKESQIKSEKNLSPPCG